MSTVFSTERYLETGSRSNWNLEMFVFEESVKPEYPEKNLSEQGREPITNSPTEGVEFKNRPHWCGRCSRHCAIPILSCCLVIMEKMVEPMITIYNESVCCKMVCLIPGW